MSNKVNLLALALIWTACATVYSVRAAATSCGTPETAGLLELQSVEVDGQQLTDLADYEDPGLEYVVISGVSLEIGGYVEQFELSEAP